MHDSYFGDGWLLKYDHPEHVKLISHDDLEHKYLHNTIIK